MNKRLQTPEHLNQKLRHKTHILNIIKTSFRDGIRLLMEKCTTTYKEIVFPYMIEENNLITINDLSDQLKMIGFVAL